MWAFSLTTQQLDINVYSTFGSDAVVVLPKIRNTLGGGWICWLVQFHHTGANRRTIEKYTQWQQMSAGAFRASLIGAKADAQRLLSNYLYHQILYASHLLESNGRALQVSAAHLKKVTKAVDLTIAQLPG